MTARASPRAGGDPNGPARAVFLGSGAFAVPALVSLSANPLVALSAVVTAPPRPAGRRQELRPSPVASRAQELGVTNLLDPPRLRAPEVLAAVAALAPQLLVLADYGQIVPPALLDLPPHGALNLHPSLLPRHRGASPIAAAIFAGDRETGVTIIRMDEGLDTGPIVAQRRVPLDELVTAPELEEELAGVAADLLAEVLGPWLSGALVAQPQPEEGVTLTRPLAREDGRLDPRRSAAELARQVRAYQPWPGSFLETAAGRIVVWAAAPVALTPDGASAAWSESTELEGTLLPDGAGLALAVSDGALRLLEVQPAGGARMNGEEFRRGRPGLIGTRVLGAALR